MVIFHGYVCECHNQMVSVESIQRYHMEADVKTPDVWGFNGFHDLHT